MNLDAVRAAQSSPFIPGWRVVALRRGAVWLGCVVALLGFYIAVAWVVRDSRLVAVWSGLAATNPVTAVCIVLSAVSLLLVMRPGRVRTPVARALATLVLIIGLVRLAAWVTPIEIHVESMLFPSASDSTGQPGPIAYNSALCFVFLSLATWLLSIRTNVGSSGAQALGLGVMLVGLLAIVGYLFSEPQFYRLNTPYPMALPTAVALALLGVCVLFADAGAGMMAVVSGEGPGSTIARRLIPACLVLPTLIGVSLFLAAERSQLSQPLAFGLTILSTIVVLLALIWSHAVIIERADRSRERAVEQLRRSELFYHTLVETLPQNIMRKDAAGRFTFANRLCEQTFGKSREEVIGKTDFDLFQRSLAEKYRADDERVMAEGATFEAVEEHVTPDGRTHYVHVIKTPLTDADGKSIGIQAIFWDVTSELLAQKQLRDQNVQLQELAASERLAHDELKQAQARMVETAKLAGLGQMVAGVAHEINNPLAFVLNNIVVLERDLKGLWAVLDCVKRLQGRLETLAPDTCAEIAQHWQDADVDYTVSNLPGLLARTRDGLGRIQRIVKDLRLFARVDEDQFVEADINVGIESTVHILLGNAKARGVSIDLSLDSIPPLRCRPTQLNQVIMNLVSNAIEACPPGGRVQVCSRQRQGRVEICVSDNGAGIDPSVRDRIFDPFFTTKPIGEGTGLGLSISYGIVKEHGGSIEVESTPGSGATFTVQLPAEVCGAADELPSGIRRAQLLETSGR